MKRTKTKLHITADKKISTEALKRGVEETLYLNGVKPHNVSVTEYRGN